MAFFGTTLATTMLLFAFLVIASATDYGYGYGPTPEFENFESKTNYKPQPTKPDYTAELKIDYKSQPTKPDYSVSEPKTDYKPQPTKPDYAVPKPNTDYNPHLTKPDYSVPEPKTDYKPQPTKPDYAVPEPKSDDYKPHPTKPYYAAPEQKGKDELQLLPTIIGVQGVVLCKSGSNYFPIQGAVARVTCGYEDERGYETGPISVLSHVTDSKGYFFSTLSLAELGSNLKLTECKAYLESSPLETCKIPTDVNYGISGARLSSYRLLHNNLKLYTVGPFFCTSQSAPAPNGY
ncbi:proline-rich protein 3 [Cajanus cajan]|uniref:Proline-rich protein 1 n=1 Tax=Cajanus cajan TaxID=3821 RepID=A0A151U4I1_CAJCA|nr:proline-rich protein 3 [Cajanus cajan]KYP74232.1 hypothetical protein KK1_006902 [Cajanus cajan]